MIEDLKPHHGAGHRRRDGGHVVYGPVERPSPDLLVQQYGQGKSHGQLYWNAEKRIVERISMEVWEGKKGRVTRTQCSGTMTKAPTSETVGWEPTCECGTKPVPCTVLDPFGGAGTVGVVATRLLRNAILIELNPEYADMAQRRIDAEPPVQLELL